MDLVALDTGGEGGPVKLDEILYELVSRPLRESNLCCECCSLRFRGGNLCSIQLRYSASSSVGPMMTSKQISVIRGDGGNRSGQRGNGRGCGHLGLNSGRG